MISGWPQRVRNSSPSARMKMSLKPPALVVVMAFTGRVGQSCAAAGERAAKPGKTQDGREQQRGDFHMGISSFGF